MKRGGSPGGDAGASAQSHRAEAGREAWPPCTRVHHTHTRSHTRTPGLRCSETWGVTDQHRMVVANAGLSLPPGAWLTAGTTAPSSLVNRPSSGDRRRVNGGDRSERRPPSSSGNANQVPQNPHESVAPALGPPAPCCQDSRRELPPRPPRERTPLPLSEPEARSPGSSLRQSRRLAGAPVHRWPTSRRGLGGCPVRAPTPFTRPRPRHRGVGWGFQQAHWAGGTNLRGVRGGRDLGV